MELLSIRNLCRLCGILILSAHAAWAAAVPPTIGYQGRLYDSANRPIDATITVTFALYSQSSGGTPVWTETQSVVFASGYFSVQLGSVTPFTSDSFDGSARFLGVTVGADAEMTPRAAIASVPYALSAGPDARLGSQTGAAVAGRGRECTLGEILLHAGTVAGATPAAGQLLPINQNTALFSLLGTMYGGNGTTTFALPDLRSAAPNGLTYAICTQGIFPARD
jgi:hypothetical protein